MVEHSQEDFVNSYSSRIEEAISEYIRNPDTRVFINYNDEAGIWQYSVQVSGTAFWLNSFETKPKALEYIEENGLKMDDQKSFRRWGLRDACK